MHEAAEVDEQIRGGIKRTQRGTFVPRVTAASISVISSPFRLARMGAHKVETCKPALMCKQAKITDEKKNEEKK